MKKLILTTSALLTLSLGQLAMASDLSVEKRGQRGCRAANLTQAQKQEMKELRMSSRKEMKELRKQRRQARKSLRQTLLSADSTAEQAAEAQEVLLNLKDQAVDIRVSNKLHILYNIASVEQRKPLLRCMAKAKNKKSKKGKRGKRFKRGRG